MNEGIELIKIEKHVDSIISELNKKLINAYSRNKPQKECQVLKAEITQLATYQSIIATLIENGITRLPFKKYEDAIKYLNSDGLKLIEKINKVKENSINPSIQGNFGNKR